MVRKIEKPIFGAQQWSGAVLFYLPDWHSRFSPFKRELELPHPIPSERLNFCCYSADLLGVALNLSLEWLFILNKFVTETVVFGRFYPEIWLKCCPSNTHRPKLYPQQAWV